MNSPSAKFGFESSIYLKKYCTIELSTQGLTFLDQDTAPSREKEGAKIVEGSRFGV